MPRNSFAQIKREQAMLTSIEVTEEIEIEKIALAELLEQETPLNYDQAENLIDVICNEILPGYRGVEKLFIFRRRIRDRLKDEFIGYEEDLDHQQTISDARNAGRP